METLRDEWSGSKRQAVKALNIIIVGAGIGGLAAGLALAQTGHRVSILDSVSEITDVGAGIQVAPNASRILHRLGVLQEVMDRATVLERVSVRRYTSDEEMATFPLMPEKGLKYGAPMSVIHRGDLQKILLDKALELGCHIFTNHKVIAVDPTFSAKVWVHQRSTGAKLWLSADMIIAADGVKSQIRRQIMNSISCEDEPTPTGDAAYRLLIPRERVINNPTALSMMDQNVGMRYMGPGGHIMAYPIRDNSLYNIVLLHPAKSNALPEDVWTSKGNRDDMFKFCAGWSPAVQDWLAHVDEEILEWTLYGYPDLPTWIQGSVALLGDACHPMLPYVAQGAANAIEDAAVLATALTCTSNVALVLRIYEAIRKPRAEKIAASATATAHTLHLPDGPEQIIRDQQLTNPGAAKRNPDKWSDPKWQDLMWGVDVMERTIHMWAKLTEVLSLETCYPHLKKAYTYTLSVNISHGWLLEQLALVGSCLSAVVPAPFRQCSLPLGHDAFETATPEEVGLSSDEVEAALAYANRHGRVSVQIFRNNCLVGRGVADALTDNLPMQVFSVTKSVVGMLAGIAVADGKLDIDRPIGDYLPEGPGWGDAAHRAITVRQVLTETSGTQEAILSELLTAGLDPSAVQEFLGQPLAHAPGSRFAYSQRDADAAAYVVQRAVGRDLQDFARERLFGPLGIARSDYFWLRDRSGNTYGYAWLFVAPKHLARLGLVMQNGGRYNGRQVVPADWVRAVAEPSPRNPCYGLLFWNNAGRPCTGAGIPVATTIQQTAMASAPADAFAMVGALQQNNFMIPSLNMTVTWTGVLGDTAPNLSVLLSATPGDLYYNFFRILMRGVRDKAIPDAGPYKSPPLSLDVNPLNYLNPAVLLHDLFASAECNILFCNGGIPTEGLLKNLKAILGYTPTW
ncbi:salicylate hydroxylase [Cordyceps javanica]|uniref:Salicylate hydroxylase n=1 Tax=Cordyceps javanica TaxID=43265 RepID=A0A545WEQ4_9HYPO|nr:salicylate hydroxylase [Cordyceps javanica]TQW12470.1 salicylate hydroxylase [Cordyceps javanica]